jgi:hypothetical protein
MTGIKPSSHGIVVDHKESGVRYAVSDRNYNEKIHRKVRDLRPGETVLGYRPKRRQEAGEGQGSPAPTQDAAGDQEVGSSDQRKDTKTEGANTGTQEKEGK